MPRSHFLGGMLPERLTIPVQKPVLIKVSSTSFVDPSTQNFSSNALLAGALLTMAAAQKSAKAVGRMLDRAFPNARGSRTKNLPFRMLVAELFPSRGLNQVSADSHIIISYDRKYCQCHWLVFGNALLSS